MSKPIKHHFIPQFYLKYWQNIDSRICCYRKANNRFDLMNPKNAALQKNLYKFESEIESIFITPFIDNKFSPIINKAKQNPLESLTRNDKFNIIKFIMLLHLRNPIEIQKLVSYQNNNFLNHPAFEYWKSIFGKDIYHEFEQGYLNGILLMVGLAMKEIDFSKNDLQKIKKHKEIFYLSYITNLISQESWSSEIINKYNSKQLLFKEYHFDEKVLITSNIPVYFGKPKGFLTILFNISPQRTYVLTENKQLITKINDYKYDDMVNFFNGHHIYHKNVKDIYMHESQKEKYEEIFNNIDNFIFKNEIKYV